MVSTDEVLLTDAGPGFIAEEAPAAQQPGRHLAIGLAVLGVFVTYVPITGVSAALSRIGAATGASTSGLQWVSDGYVIPMAAAVLSGGLLGDRYGRRRVFLVGMALTVLGATLAALSGIAGTLALLWTGQAVSGLGAGVLLPTTLALIAHAVPDPRERGRFIGLWALGLSLGLAIGPLLSGLVLDHAGYGWTFVPTIALAVVAGLAATGVPESTAPGGRPLDLPGQLTATVTIAALVFGVIEGGARGWDDPLTLTGLVVAAVALVAFLAAGARADAPLLDLALFRSPAFTAAGVAAFVALFSVVGTTFLISLFLGETQHLSALQIGVRLLFLSGVTVVATPVVGAVVHRLQPALLLATGLALAAVSVFTLTGVDAHTGALGLGWRLAVFGVAVAIMLTTVSVAAVNSVPWRQAGMAAAANTALRQLGGALGPAVLGVVFVGRLGHGVASALHGAFVVEGVLLVVAVLACLATGSRSRH